MKAVREHAQLKHSGCMYVCMFCVSYLNINDGDGGLGLVEVPSHPVHGLRDVVQHQIQIHLIFLERRGGGKKEDIIIRSGK